MDDCVIAEVLALALKSLADFETDYVLKISNMDFVVGLRVAIMLLFRWLKMY